MDQLYGHVSRGEQEEVVNIIALGFFFKLPGETQGVRRG